MMDYKSLRTSCQICSQNNYLTPNQFNYENQNYTQLYLPQGVLVIRTFGVLGHFIKIFCLKQYYLILL